MSLIDLTMRISPQLPSFPGSPQSQFITWAKNKVDGYNLELIFLSSHSGTHIDAPFHFIDKGLKIDEIPLERFVCDAILFRIKKGPNQPITKSDIIKFERKHGKILNHSTIIFSTGWYRNLPKKDYFKSNPGLSADAAKYLAAKRLNLVGIDSPSIDLGKDSKFPVHHILLSKDVLVVENLCNLEKISEMYFKLIVLPLNLKGATGSPVRAIVT
ncbi:MAG TPA: cyclase family protein [Nitrosopumilaceae archaeon]|nr:cyclase family protein [Nitrosopumilaceae archaeon]